MAEWKITWSDGTECDATIDGNGLATIPENTTTQAKEYYIKYTDDNGCTAATWYTVSASSGIECEETAYEFVDLGLPSGTKWANKNLGAKCPQMPGKYYSFASITGYTGEYIENEQYEGRLMYNGLDAAYSNQESNDCSQVTYSRYGINIGGTTEYYLKSEDDAATNVNANWRTPSPDEFEELSGNTDITEIMLDNVLIGYKFTSRVDNTKYIEMPCCKYVQNGIHDCPNGNSSKIGWYWRYMTSSIVHDDQYTYRCSAFCASNGETCIESRHPRMVTALRCEGLQIRPVWGGETPPIPPSDITPIIVVNNTNKTLWIYDNITGSKIKNDMPCIEPGETWTSSIVYNDEGVHFDANVTCNMSVDEHFEPITYDIQKRYYLGDKINIKLYAEGEDEDEGWTTNEINFTGYPTDGVEFAINESGTSYKQLKLTTGPTIYDRGTWTYE